VRVGFHAPFLSALGGGEKVVLTMLAEAVARGHDVSLLSPPDTGPPDPAAWRRLGVDVPPGSFAWVAADDAVVTERSAQLDLLVALTNDVPPRSRAARAVAVVQFPVRPRHRARERALAAALDRAGRRRAPAALASYARFFAYSAFVRTHVRRRLGVDAAVLPPPVTAPAAAAPKAPIVLSVGRFFRGAHDKRHDVLVDAFARLAPPEPWALHLVGGVGDPAHLAALRGRAAGLRVVLHPDAPAAQLAGLQARAALLWHAAGYAVDPDRRPERCEHFGIAVAEGMLNGAVPVVVPAGGPAELVTDGVDGRHFRSIPGLVAATAALIADPVERDRLAAAARTSAARFTTDRFLARVRAEVLADG